MNRVQYEYGFASNIYLKSSQTLAVRRQFFQTLENQIQMALWQIHGDDQVWRQQTDLFHEKVPLAIL